VDETVQYFGTILGYPKAMLGLSFSAKVGTRCYPGTLKNTPGCRNMTHVGTNMYQLSLKNIPEISRIPVDVAMGPVHTKKMAGKWIFISEKFMVNLGFDQFPDRGCSSSYT